MKNNEKGIALVTVLALSVVALLIVGALIYMLIKGTWLSGADKRYHSALEAGKGAATIVMNKLLNGENLKCNKNNCTPCPTTENDNCKIDLGVSDFGDYNVNVYLIDMKPTQNSGTIYTFRVRAKNKNNQSEKAEIEFVYRVY
ncbi:hypothetical protein JCM14244_01810 [Venenivibrio stagnispumantis]|uniref:Uncharacterized protein n=1 Tax=Venenivibrio stagnispumantis TaxID=407998 RepID=A0AA46AE82_9AQUI|nr:hypothetical protein [Venenivibrio stagnispumantis]MCW4573339.1 hypothetical protein [Venenivibrio stagnispumantis]SMP10660.1 hypothetical protein SAMN06264868_10810 [Venenivibrio stagnispumantis]